MRRRTRLGIVAGTVAILLMAAVGIYGLTGIRDSDGGAPFLGFQLVKPAFAQSDISVMDPNAGLSAYIKIAPNTMNLDRFVTDLYDGMIQVGDNFVLGWYRQARSGVSSYGVDVYLYADDDGWLISYLAKDRLAAEAFARLETGFSNVLVAALNQGAIVGGAIAEGTTVDEAQVGYYDWAIPSATNLALASRESLGKLYMAVSQDVTVHDISLAVLCSGSNGTGSWFAPNEAGTSIPCNVNRFSTYPLLNSLPNGVSSDSAGTPISDNSNPLSADAKLGVVNTFWTLSGPTSILSGVAIVHGPKSGR